MSVPLLVTGGSGQVGGAIVRLAQARGFDVCAPTSVELDLASSESIKTYLANKRFSAIINCAAYTAVDKAEDEPVRAQAINGAAPGLLAEYAAVNNLHILQVSTDYVFDGSASGAYNETDATNPLGVYGATKLAGEQAVIASGAQAAILRTAWVVSAEGGNFINTMLRLAQTHDEVRVVDDQHGCPTSANEIAIALFALLDTRSTGLYHFVNAGKASWYDLAVLVFARAKAAGEKVPQLSAIPTSAYPTRARRPKNSVLNTAKFAKDLGVQPRSWQDAINTVLDERLNKG